LKTIHTKSVLILAGCLVGYILAGIAARIFWGLAVNNLITAAAFGCGLPLLLLLIFQPKPVSQVKQKNGRMELAEALLHSSSPMVLATALDGSFTYLNPSAERILGIRASELVGRAKMTEVFAQGEMERISQTLTRRVSELTDRYEMPMPRMIEQLEELEAKVNHHLERMGFAWS